MENLTENNWSTPQRQSPAAIFIMLMHTLGTYIKVLWPIVIVRMFREKKPDDGEPLSPMFVIVIGVGVIAVLLMPIALSLLKYWFYKLFISEGKLIIQSGWLKKKTLTIPLQNIHAVHIEQGIWQRILQVTKVSIDSAGAEKTEAKIDALSMKRAEELKTILLSQQQVGSKEVVLDEPLTNIQSKLSNADLFKLSLTANHLEAFFILIGVAINLLDNLREAFRFDSWGFMESYATKAAGQTAIIISILVVAVAVISLVVSIARTLVKYYDFKIEEVHQGWKISHGLFNRQQRIIPANKIQLLSWSANWLRRKIDFWIVKVQSVGHREEKHKQHLKIPVTSLKGVLSLAPMYQASPVFNVEEGCKIGSAYWKRKTLITGIPVTLILSAIFYIWVGVPGLIAALILFYLAWYFHKWYSVFRWQINDEGLQAYSGVWGRKFTLLTWKKMQQIQVNQSSYQRRNQLASIIFITAGGSLKLPYIQFAEAKYLANLSLYYVESRNENWM